jgi:membrane-anchored protein YejM (alkaline phosphatase superfamily)
MTVVWVALAAIGAYELWALLTGGATWSVLISTSLKGHPIKATIIFVVVIAIAGHVIFGWFNRHHHRPAPAPSADYEGY